MTIDGLNITHQSAWTMPARPRAAVEEARTEMTIARMDAARFTYAIANTATGEDIWRYPFAYTERAEGREARAHHMDVTA